MIPQRHYITVNRAEAPRFKSSYFPTLLSKSETSCSLPNPQTDNARRIGAQLHSRVQPLPPKFQCCHSFQESCDKHPREGAHHIFFPELIEKLPASQARPLEYLNSAESSFETPRGSHQASPTPLRECNTLKSPDSLLHGE